MGTKTKNTTATRVNANKVDLQRGRKLSHKNIGNLNSEVSKKTANRDDKIKFISAKDETKEKEIKESAEGKLQRTKGEKEGSERKLSEEVRHRVRKESLIKPNKVSVKTENKDIKSSELSRKPSLRRTKENVNNSNEIVPKNTSERF